MQKIYKHKKLGWVARCISNIEYSCKMVDGLKTWYYLPAKIVENSDDWELQEEKDYDNINISNENGKIIIGIYGYKDGRPDVEYDITEHMPKITKEDIINISSGSKHQSDGSRTLTVNEVKQLLKDKGLYKE